MNWHKNGWLILAVSLGATPAIQAAWFKTGATWIKEKSRNSASLVKRKCSQFVQKCKRIRLAPEDYLLLAGAICFGIMLYADAATPQRCGICLDTKSGLEFTRLACGHSYCTDCLKRLVQIGLKEKNTHNLLCPNPKCRHKMSPYNVLSISGYFSDNYADYQKITHNEYILGQPDGKQCPTPDCEYLFLAGNRPHRTRCRECQVHYCSHCLHDHSHRMTCLQAEEFRDLTPDKQASEAWKLNNSKKCPRCSSPIQKRSGCNYMTCRQCTHHFCWLCLQPREHYNRRHQCPLWGNQRNLLIRRNY